MKKSIKDWIEQYSRIDLGLLYLRLFTGGMLVLHNIGKIQDYNEIISSYPSVLYIDNTAIFVVATVIELLLAVMIMTGIYVRLAAAIMSAGLAGIIAWYGFGYAPSATVWLGVYVFFIISGGGFYAFDEFLGTTKPKK